ncbi:MAG: type II toxin-antitoxin system VapB family antitoxin [Pseudomonadota bacterium]|nr:type II toxin-antitoxin system VapB family antitoxin [Pseudomonadota bacterium]
MRTNIDIDDEVMAAAMKGGQFKTKREAVEEGLRLVARRNHAREVLKWEGKLHWDDQPDPAMQARQPDHHVAEVRAQYKPGVTTAKGENRS